MEFNLTYSQVNAKARQGEAIARKGWNGKGMYAFIAREVIISVPTASNVRSSLPCFVLFNAKGDYQAGWVASQEDMLASDWGVVELERVELN